MTRPVEDLRLAARRIVVTTCAAQGLPERVEDPEIIHQLATLFRSARAHTRRTRSTHVA